MSRSSRFSGNSFSKNGKSSFCIGSRFFYFFHFTLYFKWTNFSNDIPSLDKILPISHFSSSTYPLTLDLFCHVLWLKVQSERLVYLPSVNHKDSEWLIYLPSVNHKKSPGCYTPGLDLAPMKKKRRAQLYRWD